MTKLKYTSSIKDMPFMFSEMRRTAQLLCEGKTGEEIIALSMSENIYQLEREKRRKDVPKRMLNRLSTLDSQLISVIANGYEYDAKLIAFLALLKADRLFYEYMREVYFDLYTTGKSEITDKDFISFIERKAQDSDVVAKWASKTIARICSSYKRILCETELAKQSSDVLLIQKPYMNQDIQILLSEDMIPYARVMLLEVGV